MSEAKIPDDLKEDFETATLALKSNQGNHRELELKRVIEFVERIARAEAELSAARETITRLADAANKLIAAMDTCHICGGVLIVEEGPSHCENCSYDCEGHEGEECTPIYEYHRRLDELTLPYVTVQQDKGDK